MFGCATNCFTPLMEPILFRWPVGLVPPAVLTLYGGACRTISFSPAEFSEAQEIEADAITALRQIPDPPSIIRRGPSDFSRLPAIRKI
jgi:hypothetical protein